MPTPHRHAVLRLTPTRLIMLALACLTLLALTAASARAITMEVDPQATCVNHGDDAQTLLQANDATVLRIVVPDYPSPQALRCAEQAHAQGYHVYLSVQYGDLWNPRRVAAYFARTLAPYAPYAWAVSVGNEQDIFTKQHLEQGGKPRLARQCTGSGRRRHCESNAGAYYRQVWDAVEPVVARVTPKALRVYGETSPWGFQFLKQSFVPGPPRGAQVVGFHCYDTKWGGLREVPRVAAWAGRQHLPLWCSEMGDGIRPVSWMRHDSPLQWMALLGSVERRSPDLKMISYFQWPQISAR